MNLQKFQEFLKSPGGRTFSLFALIVIITALLLGAIFLPRVLRKEVLPTPTPLVKPLGKNPQVTNNTKVEYLGPTLALPTQIQTFDILYNPILPNAQEAKKMAATLGFPGEPQIHPELLLWISGQDSLTINLAKPVLKYSHSLLDPQLNTGSKPQADGAKETAVSFIKKIRGLASIDFDKPEISFYKKPTFHDLPPATPNDAESILISFKQTVSSVDIFPSEPNLQTLRVLVGRNNIVINAQVSLFSYLPYPSSTVPLINFEQAVEKLKAGKGILYLSADPNAEALGPEKDVGAFKDLNLNQAELNYVLTGKTLRTQPAVVFKGTGTTETNRENVIIIVPLSST